MTVDLNTFIMEPADEYHGKAKKYLSSHQLMTYMYCPYLLWKKRNGLIEEKDNESFLVGRATHTMILEGPDKFWKEYASGGPINPKTGKPFGTTTKAWQEWATEQQEEFGKTVLPDDKVTAIEKMNDSVSDNTDARQLLRQGIPEGVLRSSINGIECQIRVDWFNPDYNGRPVMVDLKTCSSLDSFLHDAEKYLYYTQFAFYQNVIENVLFVNPDVFMIAVEKSEPYRTGVFYLTRERMETERNIMNQAMKRYKNSLENDEWPTLYEGIHYVTN